ncbi:hypothetical protein ACWEOZ_12315 [Actinoplanes sp. NPDC004185]
MLDTALNVLAAIRDDRPHALPTTLIGAPQELARPSAEARLAVGRAAAAIAARLRLASPPFGDPRPAGVDGLILAVLVAVRGDPLLNVPWPRPGWSDPAWDLVLRFGLADKTLCDPLAGVEVCAALRHGSPLTGVLDHPRPADRTPCLRLVTDRLLPTRDGRQLVTRIWAQVPRGVAQAEWRGWALDVLQGDDRQHDFVLDVYRTARTWYASAHDHALVEMRQRLIASGRDPETTALAGYWRALHSLVRNHTTKMRRAYGLHDYMPAARYVELHDTHATPGAAE